MVRRLGRRCNGWNPNGWTARTVLYQGPRQRTAPQRWPSLSHVSAWPLPRAIGRRSYDFTTADERRSSSKASRSARRKDASFIRYGRSFWRADFASRWSDFRGICFMARP